MEQMQGLTRALARKLSEEQNTRLCVSGIVKYNSTLLRLLLSYTKNSKGNKGEINNHPLNHKILPQLLSLPHKS